ncbi:MAG: hypothetical protein PWQ55_2677 [Chloroflexota bacterium]|nr:hypothetical protein [Chloroflexota bacterium]
MGIPTEFTPGPLLLFGSGETLPASGKAYDHLARRYAAPLKIAILETPAGFQPNTQRVAQNVGDFLLKRLQNHQPQIEIIPARKRGTDFSPQDARILAPMLDADWAFMGPGSPTYAVQQLEGSLAYQSLRALHLRGSAVCLASAAVLAISAWTLPVYEIYKVGQDPFWTSGLNLLANFGLNVTFIPHWNNHDGGAELDTSRCFMGQERFAKLQIMLDEQDVHTRLVGIDEQTALMIEFEGEATCRVFGKGHVTLLEGGQASHFAHGHSFPLALLGAYQPEKAAAGIPAGVWEAIQSAQAAPSGAEAPEDVEKLVQQREEARSASNWAAADHLRVEIEAQGWQVMDTPDGPQVARLA